MHYNSFGILYNRFYKVGNHIKMFFSHFIFVSRVVQNFARISAFINKNYAENFAKRVYGGLIHFQN